MRLGCVLAALWLIGCGGGEDSSSSTGGQGGTGGSGGVATGGAAGSGNAAGTGGAAGAGSELLTLSRFAYQGAFRIPSGDFGQSSANYAAGPIALGAGAKSLFLVGHAQQHPLAELTIPNVVNSTQLSDLAMAPDPTQGFVTILDDVSGGNPQAIDSIAGMLWLTGANGPELLVNGYEYYDAPADNTNTTLVIRDPSNIATSVKDGYYSLTGAAHAGGWMSPIPNEWQAALGGAYITGHSSGVPIIGRLSVGPSAFVFDPMVIVGAANVPDPVPTTTLLDFSLAHPLNADLSNDSGTNKIWTHLSRAVYGFVAPGTRTYVTIGYSGGHESGVCYKCVPNDGSNCGGYCANDAKDYSHFYWLWDVDDLVAVKQGQKQPFEVVPYEYGKFPTPFPSREIGGGAFDPATGLLYLNVLDADHDQGTYAVPPLVVVYRIE
jgi:hypothetical protein